MVMEEHFNYDKRSQRDYSMSLKLQIVGEIERGELSTTSAQRKYGIQARSTLMTWLRKYGNLMGLPKLGKQSTLLYAKTPEQKIMELEAKVKLLEKQKAFLEYQPNVADKKVIIFDMMIDLAEKNIRLR